MTMKTATYQGNALPNNYGMFYTTLIWLLRHASEMFINITRKNGGMILVILRIRNRKEKHFQNRSKMEGPEFVQPLTIEQTIKYGTILYIVAIMVATPAATCNSSYQTPAYEIPVTTQSIVSELLKPSIDWVQASNYHVVALAPYDYNQYSAVLLLHSHIMRASQAYEVDSALIRAIIMAESSNNPRAVSHRGALGLMQLMPTTAKWLGVEDAFDPALNIDGGVRYLKRLLDRFDGDIKLALAAYNAGSRYVRKYGGVPPFKATRIYIKKVLRYQQKYQKEIVFIPTNLIMS
jgi:hypothetical protein